MKKPLLSSALCLALGALAFVPSKLTAQTTPKKPAKAAPKAPAVKKTDAKTLIQRLRTSTAALTIAVKKTADPKLLKTKQAVPFLSGLKDTSKSAGELSTALSKKDPSFYQKLNATGAAIAQMQGGAQLLRINDRKIIGPLRSVAITFSELRAHSGSIASNKAKGGKPAATDLAAAKKLQKQAAGFRGKLGAMHAKAKATKNARLLQQCDDLMILCAELEHWKGFSDAIGLARFFASVEFMAWQWESFGSCCEHWYPAVYASWQTCDTEFETWEMREETVESWSWSEESFTVVDSTEEYHIGEVDETEVTEAEEWTGSYDEAEATESFSEEELAEESTDEDTDDETVFEMEEDEDGDGLSDAQDSDDDGDGIADAKDNDDNGDGVADDDEDGDGTPDEADMDDDGDGTPDAEDTDDDGDGVEDAEEEMVEEEPADESEDSGDDAGGGDDSGDDGN